MKEAYKKCMKEKNTIKIKSYESHPAECCCSVHLAENSACVTGRWKNTAIV